MAEKRSYLGLKDEVWDLGTCSGCGACVAVCPADALFFIDEPGILHPSSTGYCKQESDGVRCGACYEVCPRLQEQKHEPVGNYRKIVAARATGQISRKQSGGAVTAILTSAMASGDLDGVVTVTEDPLTHRPQSVLITSSGDLSLYAGTRYNWSVPVLKSLKEAVIEKKLNRIAVVGTACVVEAARIMKESDHDLLRPFGRSIRLIIGLFCTETFDYHVLMEEILKGTYHLEPSFISRMDVKGHLEVTDIDGKVRNFSLEETARAVRNGCHFCTDLSALDADISAGNIGTPDGYSTLVLRTDVGEIFCSHAVKNAELEITDQVNISAIEKLARSKISRAEKR